MTSFASRGLVGVRAVARKHLTIFLRSPMEVTLTLFAPVLWLLLFGVALESFIGASLQSPMSYIAFMAPGLVALTAMTAALFAGATFFLEVERGEAKQYLSAPIARVEYYLGLAAAACVKAATQSLIILLLAVPLGMHILSVGALVTATAVVAVFALGAFGFSAWLAMRSGSFEAYHGMLIMLNLPLLFLSDALYPLETLPAWMAGVAAANPLSHLVEVLRFLLVGEPSPFGLGINAAVLAGFTVVGMWLGHKAVAGIEA